jgi:hypothetical protein
MLFVFVARDSRNIPHSLHHIKWTFFVLDARFKDIYFMKFVQDLHPASSLFNMPFEWGKPQRE